MGASDELFKVRGTLHNTKCRVLKTASEPPSAFRQSLGHIGRTRQIWRDYTRKTGKKKGHIYRVALPPMVFSSTVKTTTPQVEGNVKGGDYCFLGRSGKCEKSIFEVSIMTRQSPFILLNEAVNPCRLIVPPIF